MQIYLVGGAVRDKLLGIPAGDRDWVVVGGSIAEMERLGYRRLDREFPVFSHPETGEEYALARTETKTGAGYRGFTVDAGPGVTLEQDLRRRDLTINAMAETVGGELVDPFGGEEDLRAGFLRHVSPAFVEDPVRLLRIARFAARLDRWGFRVAHRTHALLQEMVHSGEVPALNPDRIWQELERALGEDRPVRFLEVLHACGALEQVFPEIARHLVTAVAHDAAARPKPFDRLAAASEQTGDAEVRYAVMASVAGDAQAVKELSSRIHAPGRFRDLALLVVAVWESLQAKRPPDGEHIMQVLEQLDAFRRSDRFDKVLAACNAIAEGVGDKISLSRVATLNESMLAAQAVDPGQLKESGLAGSELGAALRTRRMDAICANLKDSSPG